MSNIKTLKDLQKELKKLFNCGVPYFKEKDYNVEFLSLTNCLDFSPAIETMKDINIVRYSDDYPATNMAGCYQLCFREYLDDGNYLADEEPISPCTKNPQKIFDIVKICKEMY